MRLAPIVAVLVILLLAGGCGTEPAPQPPRLLAEGDEVTFLVTGDTHLGAEGMVEQNERQIDAMNALPGTPWPADLGGHVERPTCVFVVGDLTDRGRLDEWAAFTRLYGSSQVRGRLAYPALVGTGNHDRPVPVFSPVVHAVAMRQGSPFLAVRLGPLHVVGCDLYPNAAMLRWLRRQLEAIGPTAPVVLWFHYGLAGPWSDWWTDEEKAAFREAVRGFRIAGIFHGHYHRSSHYEWRGLQVFNVGSPRHSDHSFACVRWRDDRLEVAAWDWERGRWAWHHGAAPEP